MSARLGRDHPGAGVDHRGLAGERLHLGDEGLDHGRFRQGIGRAAGRGGRLPVDHQQDLGPARTGRRHLLDEIARLLVARMGRIEGVVGARLQAEAPGLRPSRSRNLRSSSPTPRVARSIRSSMSCLAARPRPCRNRCIPTGRPWSPTGRRRGPWAAQNTRGPPRPKPGYAAWPAPIVQGQAGLPAGPKMRLDLDPSSSPAP